MGGTAAQTAGRGPSRKTCPTREGGERGAIMRFIWRELMGWLLVVAGLGVLFNCYVLIVSESKLFEAAPLSIIGIIVFRGGIHLLKVAVAARICSLAKERTR